jgi:hypothetical protein
MHHGAAEPQPKRETAILAVSVTGGTPVPQCGGQRGWPYIMRKMFAKEQEFTGSQGIAGCQKWSVLPESTKHRPSGSSQMRPSVVQEIAMTG